MNDEIKVDNLLLQYMYFSNPEKCKDLAYERKLIPTKNYYNPEKYDNLYKFPYNFCKGLSYSENKKEKKLVWHYGIFTPEGYDNVGFDCIIPADFDNWFLSYGVISNTVCQWTGDYDCLGIPIFVNDYVESDYGYCGKVNLKDWYYYKALTMNSNHIKINSNNIRVTSNYFDKFLNNTSSFEEWLEGI